MLESGFLRIDPATCLPLHHASISGSWPKEHSTALSLQYSLPEILAGGNDKTLQGVVLKLQSLGRFMIVYGSLMPANSKMQRVCLKVTAFCSKIRLMIDFFNENGITRASPTPATCSDPERAGFMLWKCLKDGLVLPMLIDLSDKAGSRNPSSFSTIHAELKLKIMERMKGVDLARLGCVCSYLHQLSSNGDLWKKVYMEEFIELPLNHDTVTDWKETFARSWRQVSRRRHLAGHVLYHNLRFYSLWRGYHRGRRHLPRHVVDHILKFNLLRR